MPLRIEDYALIGDCETSALVGRDGSVDWLCLPRFDSGACFAALLGSPEHGRFRIAPANEARRVTRRYRDGTLVLETEFETDEGVVQVVDCMPMRNGSQSPTLVRLVVGIRGRVAMRMDLSLRFDYGSLVPWVRHAPGGLCAVAGPDAVRVSSDVELRGEGLRTVADFTVAEGERVPFTLIWYRSHRTPPIPPDASTAIGETEATWLAWSSRARVKGPYAELVRRSLITLKALTYAPTGGIVAAPTTSLPEQPGGVRNWDYRFCWLRDATFTLYSLMNAGYVAEAEAWRDWLLRAVAGAPEQTQIMYGVGGERRLSEFELDWLPGYEGAAPVRVGNAASKQFQLDVYGEVLDALHLSRRVGLPGDDAAWNLERALVSFVEKVWTEPDEGIWEVRGPRRHFTHSKVMAWVAVDRAVKSMEQYHLDGPLDRWRALRDQIHREVCAQGFDTEQGTFTQFFGGKTLDASLLILPLVGFLPASDPRVASTVAAIERVLLRDGLVARYETESNVDGLPGGEGVFLPCTFWLADTYVLLGRVDEARAVFERLAGLCNDVGLIAEEYDPVTKRLLGNFPQAFTHVSLVNTARNLNETDEGPASQRRGL